METEKKNDSFIEELSQMYEDSISDIKEGQLLKGKIVQISDKDILVDVGYKSEGVVHKSEFSDPDELELGGEIDVMLESKENDMGMVVLSHEKAKRFKGWQNIIENYKEGDVLHGKVFKKVRGGFMVDVGMEAFLPASLSMMQDSGGGDNLLGEKLDFKVVKINIPRKNIVLSRKEIVEEKRKEEKQSILECLNKGDVVKGVVRNITDFGAFVDIGGGITGLLHITDISWGRINHPSEMLKVGDNLEVKILDFDKANVRVSLGLKQAAPNPWEDIAMKYPEGSVTRGKVVNIMPYGIFVELEKGIEGLIHISEFSWSKKIGHPSEKFKTGDKVEAVVLKIDKNSQKLSLGIKQLGDDPWKDVDTRYKVGDRVKGVVSAVTDYGAFVELEKGVEGLVHVSDLSWTKRVAHPKDLMKKSEEIEAVVLNVDEQNRRIALGVKQLGVDPWDEIIKKYEPGTISDGKVTNITNFGMFVELEDELEGLLHVSEINLAPSERMEEKYKVGDVLKVKVIHIDGVQKKIALTSKEFDGESDKKTDAGEAQNEVKEEVPIAPSEAFGDSAETIQDPEPKEASKEDQQVEDKADLAEENSVPPAEDSQEENKDSE